MSQTHFLNGSGSLWRTVIANPVGVFLIHANHADLFPAVLQEL